MGGKCFSDTKVLKGANPSFARNNILYLIILSRVGCTSMSETHPNGILVKPLFLLLSRLSPLWCRPYLVNLLPCLSRITKRQEETVQETLAAAIPKIMSALGNFANDGEIKVSSSPVSCVSVRGISPPP